MFRRSRPDFNYGFNAGSYYYEHRAAYPDERKWQIGDILYWNKGNHSCKFGVDAVHNYDLMNNTFKSNGDFSYNWVGNMFNDMLNFKHGVNVSHRRYRLRCQRLAERQRCHRHLSLLPASSRDSAARSTR